MNDLDIRQIRNTLMGGQRHLGNLSVMVSVYQAGKVIIGGQDMSLTQGQKNGVKTAFDTLATKIETRADTLPDRTGKVGVANQPILDEIQATPRKVFLYLEQELFSKFDTLLQREVAEIEGEWNTPYADEEAQEWANKLKTLGEGIKFYVGVERLKMP